LNNARIVVASEAHCGHREARGNSAHPHASWAGRPAATAFSGRAGGFFEAALSHNPDWILKGLRDVFKLIACNRPDELEIGRAGRGIVCDVEKTVRF